MSRLRVSVFNIEMCIVAWLVIVFGNQCQVYQNKTNKQQNVQHIAFPRGPPPQYYRYSRQLNFAVRMGSGDPA